MKRINELNSRAMLTQHGEFQLGICRLQGVIWSCIHANVKRQMQLEGYNQLKLPVHDRVWRQLGMPLRDEIPN